MRIINIAREGRKARREEKSTKENFLLNFLVSIAAASVLLLPRFLWMKNELYWKVLFHSFRAFVGEHLCSDLDEAPLGFAGVFRASWLRGGGNSVCVVWAVRWKMEKSFTGVTSADLIFLLGNSNFRCNMSSRMFWGQLPSVFMTGAR